MFCFTPNKPLRVDLWICVLCLTAVGCSTTRQTGSSPGYHRAYADFAVDPHLPEWTESDVQWLIENAQSSQSDFLLMPKTDLVRYALMVRDLEGILSLLEDSPQKTY